MSQRQYKIRFALFHKLLPLKEDSSQDFQCGDVGFGSGGETTEPHQLCIQLIKMKNTALFKTLSSELDTPGAFPPHSCVILLLCFP